jgi:hypothetical protein
MRRACSMGLIGLIFLWAPVLTAGQSVEGRAFGLIVGHNGTDDPKVASLRYADDDAVRNAKLLTQLGAPGGFILLTRLDPESRALYPDARPTPPTRRAIAQAMEKLNGLMEQARAQGAKPVFYLFYSGHGDVENNRGYVHLEDGRFYREDILALLRGSKAINNHVVIDACKSYFLVFDRGTGGSRRPVGGQLLGDHEALAANTGVFLSTSSAADSHEWEAFQGGVFSHEIRSALRGAADADGDDSISYEEAAAFVWTANQAIINRRYRPVFFTRPPRDAQAGPASVLVDLSGSTADRLVVGPGVDDHFYLEDGQGIRLADVHPGKRQRVALVLPRRRPLFVRFPSDELEVVLPPGPASLLDLPLRRSSVLRRGAEHVAFRSLFHAPFDIAAVAAFRQRPAEEVVAAAAKTDWTWVRRGVGIAAIAFGLAGGSLTGVAYAERDSVDPDTTGLARARVNERIDRFNTAAVTSYALAGAALAGYLVWTLWPDDEIQLQLIPLGEPQMGLSMRF